MTLQELLAGLMGIDDRPSVVKALQESAHPIFQAIFDNGHAAATAELKKAQERLEGELNTAKADLLKAQERAAAGGGTDEARKKEIEGYQTEIADLKTKVKQAEADAKTQIKAERHKMALADLKSRLIARKVHPDYADVLVQKQEVRDRIEPTDDGTLKVMQAGKTIPYAPSEGKEALDLMAEDLFAKTDKMFVLANGDRGSGQRDSGGSGGGSYLKNLREQVLKEREGEGKSSIELLDERLGRTASR